VRKGERRREKGRKGEGRKWGRGERERWKEGEEKRGKGEKGKRERWKEGEEKRGKEGKKKKNSDHTSDRKEKKKPTCSLKPLVLYFKPSTPCWATRQGLMTTRRSGREIEHKTKGGQLAQASRSLLQTVYPLLGYTPGFNDGEEIREGD